jgi:hypothetical protein
MPADFRAAVQVTAFLDRLGQAEGLPQIRHRSSPVTAQHLEHQAHAEQRQCRARRFTGLSPQGEGPAHQLLLSGYVRLSHRSARHQPGDVAVMLCHPQAADGTSFPRTVASLHGNRLRLAEQPLRLGELPGPERAFYQRLIGQRAQTGSLRMNRHDRHPIAAPGRHPDARGAPTPVKGPSAQLAPGGGDRSPKGDKAPPWPCSPLMPRSSPAAIIQDSKTVIIGATATTCLRFGAWVSGAAVTRIFWRPPVRPRQARRMAAG